MPHVYVLNGVSRSFPHDSPQHDLVRSATGRLSDGSPDKVLVLAGNQAGQRLQTLGDVSAWGAVVVELGTECLGDHTGESRGVEGSNVLGFARFRMGSSAPSALVEVVRQPSSEPAALAAARRIFEEAGLVVAVCHDFPGRIVDRLIRPYLNAALRRLDEQLASADDLDTTLRLGLGYPEGPIALLERTGLAEHFDVTQALYEALGDAAFSPARRARVAQARRASGQQ